MNRFGVTSLCVLGACLLLPRVASATKSAELYTSTAYPYGRFEARMQFTAGDGVVSAYFLWKDGSEVAGTFWNELDYEKIGATCQLSTNALYGNPSENHTTKPTTSGNLCSGFHVYAYEWTADYIAWFLDGTEIRRETGATAAAFAQNASAMQIHFNLWPGDASFGGNFNPSILPVHQYIDWVQYFSYSGGTFTLAWREDFDATTAPTGWVSGDWGSPKNLSTHDPLNVNFLSGVAVLSMTADDATGPAGAMPDASGGMGGTVGTGGRSGGGMGGMAAGGTAGSAAGAGPEPGGAGGMGTAGGMSAAGGAGGDGVAPAVGGAAGSGPTTGGAAGAGATSPNGGAPAVGGQSSSGATNAGGQAGTPMGTGGSTGGSSSAGTSPIGGDPGTGGTVAAAGGPAGDGSKPEDSSGCGCRVPGATSSSQWEPAIGASLLLALAGAFRRRRASRAEGSRS